jgi:hypothetical protein
VAAPFDSTCSVDPKRRAARQALPDRALFAGEAAQVARAVELDERLAASTGTHLAARDQGVTADGATVGRSARELALIEDRSGACYHPRTPLGLTPRILPAVHRCRRQARARKGNVEKREPLVPFGHEVTLTGVHALLVGRRRPWMPAALCM